MSIADGRFGAELITSKGRIYKFDDIKCLLDYKNEKTNTDVKLFFVNDYNADNVLINATNAFYVQSEDLRSPMGGNYAAFLEKETAMAFSLKNKATVQTWTEIME
jgi:copper chaperone NosL